MKTGENYSRLVAVAFVLSIGILIAFQIYILREPERVQSVLAADQAGQVARGEKLFADNCVQCHGSKGEGDIGPALNHRTLLKSTSDEVFFNLIGGGVPGTSMPSWSQTFGGPFTDEQIRDLVAFVRHWEPTASDIPKPTPTPNPAQGATLFATICYACHGPKGEGTNHAPPLNSKELLTQFDDAWLRQTITKGRPAQGMPTWGKVLAPSQIDALIVFIRSWQATAPSTGPRAVPPAAATPAPATPVLPAPTATPAPATPVLPAPTATPAPATPVLPAPTATTVSPSATRPAPAPTLAPTASVEVPRPSNAGDPGQAINLKGDITNGIAVFNSKTQDKNCAACHGPEGKGNVQNPGSSDGTVPPLNPIDDALKDKDSKVFATNIDLFIEHGSTPGGPNPQLLMPAWGDEKKLSPQEIADVIAYVMSLNQ
jgi:mono/diheme cytochrome c family protein